MAYNGEEVLIGDSVLTLTNKLNDAIGEIKRLSYVMDESGIGSMSLPNWFASKQYPSGTIIATETDKYKVDMGISGTSNPQFTSGTGMDGSVTIEFFARSAPWVAGKSYVVGDHVHSNGIVYKVTVAGTSSTTGFGPIVQEGEQVDGTVTWLVVATTAVFRKSSTPYVEGTIIIVADARLYKVIPGTSGTSKPTHTSGTVTNGTLRLTWKDKNVNSPILTVNGIKYRLSVDESGALTTTKVV
ncbi:hypothetical protein M3_0020 [Lysinibacillus phage vB_LfM_LysYB1]|nr:hypothetical protein M3_0020 [Lysinibacillus phage vB_LfM_LysYB1]WAB25237.1 hypothetical protein M5_0059 [Lysinibacillus phage vB_LfM_LysYB2]